MSFRIRPATGEDFAATSCMARLTRDSSPPDATLASERSGRLGCEATSNSTCSAPEGPGSGRSLSEMANFAPAMANCCMAAVTALPSASAAALRLALSFFACPSNTLRAGRNVSASALPMPTDWLP